VTAPLNKHPTGRVTRREAMLTVGAAALMAGAAPRPARPNFVILLADDLGWARVGYNNPKVKTPNIDRFAREGVKLTNYYAMLNCSPTRAGMLTGRYPIRFGLQSAVVRPWDLDEGLPKSEITIADQLARAGYKHRAIFGKWHLGHGRREFHPLSHGFTEFFGNYNGFIDYYTHARNGEQDLHRGFEPVSSEQYRGKYYTNLLEAEALRFLGERAADRESFLLYVPFTNPHAPIQSPPTHMEDYPDESAQRRTHMAMVSAMDDSIGRILAALASSGLDRNTVVLFASDNGGDLPNGGENTPLRGGKGTVYQGGIRVPAAIRWPAGGLIGGREVSARISYIDLAPTFLRLAGAPRSPNQFDGVDVMPLLRGAADTGRALFTMTGSERDGDGEVEEREVHEAMAVDDGRWKLQWRRWPVIGGQPGQWRREEVQLFRIAVDPFERNDVAMANPQVVERLKARALGFRALQGKAPEKRFTTRPPADFKPPKDWRIPA
jgi:arylsulfatase B